MTKILFETITEGISLLKTPFGDVWSGVYLIRSEDGKNYLIDSGASAEVVNEVIVPALSEIGLQVTDLDFVLCTHTHGDHVGGHAQLRKLGAGSIGVYEKGLDKMRDPLKYSKLIRATFPEHSPLPPAKLDGLEPDFLMKDLEKIGILQLIATPGHDTDCVSYLHLPSGILLTGDSLQGNGTDTQGCALYMDLAAYRDSIRKLQKFHLSGIVPGHAFNPWLNSFPGDEDSAAEFLEENMRLTHEYDEFLASELKRGVTDPAELAVNLIRHLDGVMPKKLFLALYTVTEHLKNLKK